jgi:hypothetical protein
MLRKKGSATTEWFDITSTMTTSSLLRFAFCCPRTAGPGVTKVAVSFKNKTATIVYDDAKADVNQLTSATTNAG